MSKVVASGTENQKNYITGIDQIELNLLHYFFSLVICYCQFYCLVFKVSKLGRTIIASYDRMNCTHKPAAVYGRTFLSDFLRKT